MPISEEEFTKEDKDKDNIEYICKHCRRDLIKIDEDGEYYCNHCSISQFPDVEEVRSEHRLVTPIGLNLEPCLSYLPDPNDQFFSDRKQEIKGGLKALQDRGIRITSYNETGGDGKSLRSHASAKCETLIGLKDSRQSIGNIYMFTINYYHSL